MSLLGVFKNFITMTNNKTLTIIKPKAVENNCIGKIFNEINQAGFRITAMKMMELTTNQAKTFYEVHKERPFYEDLVAFMTSGAVVVAQLEKDNAVEDFRKLIGATDPAKAEAGTIRALCGTSIESNAIHGSDSVENAERECAFFFAASEVY
jgi:nucleoside-diphosphate kinase